MTTIAWDEEMIAWDSLITMGDEKYVHHDTQKVVSHKGRVFTLCGDAGLLKKTLIPWWEKGHKADAAPDGDWEMVVIGTDGAFLYSSGNPGAEVSTPNVFAMGSGSMAARAALMCEKDPAGAVNVAAALDKCTGGPVNWLRLSDHVKKPVMLKSKTTRSAEMSTKQPLLDDYFVARKYEFTPPGFAASPMSPIRSPSQNILPLVDDRGFLITLIPEDHRLYREAYNFGMRGYPNTLFEIELSAPIPDFMEFTENVKEDPYYKKMRCSLRTFRQRCRDGSEYILYVLMTPDLCEELFDDGSLPDLRGVFR